MLQATPSMMPSSSQAGPAALAERRLHIAYVTETYPPDVNGVATTVASMVEGLRRRGHSVQLVRPRPSKAGAPGAVSSAVRGRAQVSAMDAVSRSDAEMESGA